MVFAMLKSTYDAPFFAILAVALSELSYNVVIPPPTLLLYPMWLGAIMLSLTWFNGRLRLNYFLPIYIIQQAFFATHPTLLTWNLFLPWAYYAFNITFISFTVWKMRA